MQQPQTQESDPLLRGVRGNGPTAIQSGIENNSGINSVNILSGDDSTQIIYQRGGKSTNIAVGDNTQQKCVLRLQNRAEIVELVRQINQTDGK